MGSIITRVLTLLLMSFFSESAVVHNRVSACFKFMPKALRWRLLTRPRTAAHTRMEGGVTDNVPRAWRQRGPGRHRGTDEGAQHPKPSTLVPAASSFTHGPGRCRGAARAALDRATRAHNPRASAARSAPRAARACSPAGAAPAPSAERALPCRATGAVKGPVLDSCAHAENKPLCSTPAHAKTFS